MIYRFFVKLIMRLFILGLVCSLSILSQAQNQSKKLVIIGDSLTEGLGVAKESAYPDLLEKKIKASGKNWIVVNSGISGSTTASAYQRVKWTLKEHTDLIMLVLGANDGLRGLKMEESEKNLSKAIEEIQKNKVKVILVGVYVPPNYGKEYANRFKKMYVNLSKKYKIKLIPFILEKVAGNPKLNLADGIHPNEDGHKIIAEHLYSVIKDDL